jgi:hypothetical protein
VGALPRPWSRPGHAHPLINTALACLPSESAAWLQHHRHSRIAVHAAACPFRRVSMSTLKHYGTRVLLGQWQRCAKRSGGSRAALEVTAGGQLLPWQAHRAAGPTDAPSILPYFHACSKDIMWLLAPWLQNMPPTGRWVVQGNSKGTGPLLPLQACGL